MNNLRMSVMPFLYWIFGLLLIVSSPSYGKMPEATGPKVARDAINALHKFGDKVARTHRFKYICYGVTGTITRSDRSAYELGFSSRGAYTQEGVRPIIVDVVEKFLIELRDNEKYVLLLRDDASRYSWVDTVLTPERIGLKLGFWDENFDRPLPPYIAQIMVRDGKILYYQANAGDQSLKDPIVETFEEAFKQVGKQVPHFRLGKLGAQ